MEKGSKSRRKAAEMEVLVRKWQQSGQSRAEFCREAGIAAWVFQYWLSRYQQEQPGGADTGFKEILVKGGVKEEGFAGSVFGSVSGSIRIKHPCGIEIELSDGTSASYLRELLAW